MAQTRTPRLISCNDPAVTRAVVLVLPGGMARSNGRYLAIAEWGLRPLLTRLAAAGAEAGVAVRLLRYRVRGWNGDAADTLTDTQWALDEIIHDHGSVPVLLAGNSLGGRAAFRAAGHPSVAGVAGIAPWLPEGEPTGQLAGREVLILHGDRDNTEAGAALSLSYAMRARQEVPGLARMEIPGANHFLLRGGRDCYEMCTEFALSVLTGSRRGPLLEAAAGGDLRTPVPTGYRTDAGLHASGVGAERQAGDSDAEHR